MRFNTIYVLLATFAAGAAATPYPGGSYCKRNCSPDQINDAFKAPSYLSDTKNFCRKFMHLPATIWVTKTRTSYVTNYHTYTKTKTRTAYPVTVTSTDFESVTITKQVTAYTTITDTEVSTETDIITATYTVTKFQPKPYYFQSYDRQKRDDIHIFERGDYEYSSAYKIPPYLPQDLNPEQIGYACKKIKPCITRTSTIYKTVTIPSYKTKTIKTVTTVTPTVSATITLYKTYVETISILKTDTITNTLETTVTATSSLTVTKTAICNKGPAPCDLKHPEACCSGHCAKILKTPNCCVLKGESCDIYHPEGCCSGKCKAQSYSYGKPVYKCL